MKSLQNLMLLLIAVACNTAYASGNLLADHSFENGIDPLPDLTAVISPTGFVHGLWGAERGGEVRFDRGVWPAHWEHMLYMEDEGLTVTQAFQAVDVTPFAALIDSGQAVADYRALVNTYLANQVFVPGLMFFADDDDWGNPIGQAFWNQSLDSDPNTWENFVRFEPIPVGTRWIIAQVGFADAPLPDGERAYVDATMLQIVPVPEPGSLLALGAGLASLVSLRLRKA